MEHGDSAGRRQLAAGRDESAQFGDAVCCPLLADQNARPVIAANLRQAQVKESRSNRLIIAEVC